MEEQPNTGSLKHKTLRGIRFTTVSTVAGMVLQVGSLAILARLLTPADYGVVAAALVFTSPLQSILLSPCERAIVLQGDMSDRGLSSAFLVSVGVGLSLAVVTGLLGLGAFLLGNRQFGACLALLSPSLVFNAAGLAPRARLRVGLEFGKITLCELAAQFLGMSLVAIVCALQGLGPYSLVIGTCCQTLLQAVLCWRLAPVKFRLFFGREAASRLIKTSSYIGQISILDTLQTQLLFVATWAYWGHGALGLMNRAYYIIQLPAQLLVRSLTNVMFVGFNLVKSERARLASSMRKLAETGSVIIFPITTGMAVCAKELTLVVLGEKWSATVPLIQCMAIGTALVMSGSLFAMMVEAVNFLREKRRMQVFVTLSAVLLYAGLGLIGLVGTSLAFVAVSGVFLIGQAALVARILEIPLGRMLTWFFPGIVTSIAILLSVIPLRLALQSSPRIGLLAAELIMCGLASYVTMRSLYSALFSEILGYVGVKVILERLASRLRNIVKC